MGKIRKFPNDYQFRQLKAQQQKKDECT